MSDKYDWLSMDMDGDCFGDDVTPVWDGTDWCEEGGSSTILYFPPPWIEPCQLYKRGSDLDEYNSDCVYQFDGSLWTLEEDYGAVESEPEYKWLAMDGYNSAEVWEQIPEWMDGIEAWNNDNYRSRAAEDNPPPFLKPCQLWERETKIQHKGLGSRWNGYWWRLVEDNSASANATTRGTILDEAKTIINGERQDQYGSPEDSFALIAEYWNTYMASIHGKDIDAKDVSVMMVLFKLARQANQHKRDNLVDAAGYLGILGDMQDT